MKRLKICQLIEKLRATDDPEEQDKIKEKIDLLEEELFKVSLLV